MDEVLPKMMQKTLDLHIFQTFHLQPLFLVILIYGCVGVLWTLLP